MSAFADIQTRFNGAAGAQTTFDTKVHAKLRRRKEKFQEKVWCL
jgi:hypothetical protein